MSEGPLDLSQKTALAVGSSQGIGSAVAIRLAELGASVLLVGRDEERLKTAVAQAKEVSPAGSGATFDYLCADLSLVSGIKKAVDDIANKIPGETKHIDYVVQTQGGTPNGRINVTSEGHDSQFIVQTVSRFGIPYLLHKRGILNANSAVVSIGGPGGGGSKLDLDDLSLIKAAKRGEAGKGLWMNGILVSVSREANVSDSFCLELNRRCGGVRVYHVFPGFVATNVLSNAGWPWPIGLLAGFAGIPMQWVGLAQSPKAYADIPVALLANKKVWEGKGKLLDPKYGSITISKWASERPNREKIWEKLTGMFA